MSTYVCGIYSAKATTTKGVSVRSDLLVDSPVQVQKFNEHHVNERIVPMRELHKLIGKSYLLVSNRH